MDMFFITVLTIAILAVAAYGLNTFLHIKGMTVFPILRLAEKGETMQIPSRFSENSEVAAVDEGRKEQFLNAGGEDMIVVEQLIKKDPLKIRTEESVQTVAEKMLQHHVGSLLVEDGQGVVRGIVTETDIIRKVTAPDISPARMRVGQVMSFPVITIDRERPITEADELMDKHHTRHLGVTDNGQIIGILSVRDLLHPIHQEQGA
jgi:CBS domain-containing protein